MTIQTRANNSNYIFWLDEERCDHPVIRFIDPPTIQRPVSRSLISTKSQSSILCSQRKYIKRHLEILRSRHQIQRSARPREGSNLHPETRLLIPKLHEIPKFQTLQPDKRHQTPFGSTKREMTIPSSVS